ncbi:hypothetical protein BH23GEM9_BH23GEM9_29990 [soil metagenome]
MPVSSIPSSISLAGAEAGDRIRVHSIPSGDARTYCEAIGIMAGDVLRCRGSASASLLLVTSRGRTVSFDRDRARFIRVSRTCNGVKVTPLP